MFKHLLEIFAVFLFMGCKSQQINTIGGNDLMNITINTNAPVVEKNEIIINAPLDKIIGILGDINNWINWRKSLTKSKLLDPLGENAKFEWTSDGLNYKSTIHTYKENAFGWTGTTFGAYAIHNWFFIVDGEKTIVKVEESLEGFLIKIMKKSMQKKLDKIIIDDLNDLKEECEKR